MKYAYLQASDYSTLTCNLSKLAVMLGCSVLFEHLVGSCKCRCCSLECIQWARFHVLAIFLYWNSLLYQIERFSWYFSLAYLCENRGRFPSWLRKACRSVRYQTNSRFHKDCMNSVEDLQRHKAVSGEWFYSKNSLPILLKWSVCRSGYWRVPGYHRSQYSNCSMWKIVAGRVWQFYDWNGCRYFSLKFSFSKFIFKNPNFFSIINIYLLIPNNSVVIIERNHCLVIERKRENAISYCHSLDRLRISSIASKIPWNWENSSYRWQFLHRELAEILSLFESSEASLPNKLQRRILQWCKNHEQPIPEIGAKIRAENRILSFIVCHQIWKGSTLKYSKSK